MSPGNPDLFGPGEAAEGPFEDAPSGLFGAVAEAGERVKIGRPQGARNRKSEAFERWYFARYKDPAVALGELVTMDPRALQQLLIEDKYSILGREGKVAEVPGLLELIKLQIAAAGELMPYLHGKVPQAVVVAVEQLPALIINAGLNQVDQVREIEGQKALAIGPRPGEDEANEINDLGAMG